MVGQAHFIIRFLIILIVKENIKARFSIQVNIIH